MSSTPQRMFLDESSQDAGNYPMKSDSSTMQQSLTGASSLEANCISNEEYSNVTADCYDAFFQEAFNSFNAEMEHFYACLGKMEQKESSVQSEILTKIEEMKRLGQTLRTKRDGALQAIGQLTTFDFNKRRKPHE